VSAGEGGVGAGVVVLRAEGADVAADGAHVVLSLWAKLMLATVVLRPVAASAVVALRFQWWRWWVDWSW
jgi:hypothetical protein